MVRTNPWPKTPPGNLAQSSFSRASTKRVLMRVALVSSSRETSRISRSRFRRSPKFPLAMNWNLSLTIQVQPRSGRHGGHSRKNGSGVLEPTISRGKRVLKKGETPKVDCGKGVHGGKAGNGEGSATEGNGAPGRRTG